MAATDIDPVIARIANRIGTVPNIGLVHQFDPFDRDDLRPFVVSTIGGQPVMRAWWISGPTMTSRRMTQTSAGYLERTWTYTIRGVEGLTQDTGPQARLRSNALAITDAIDADRDLNGTCHRTDPCTWQIVENRPLWRGIAVVYAEIRKTVTTLSTP